MNFWDSLCASCDAPQEVEPDDRDHAAAAAASNHGRQRSQTSASSQGGAGGGSTGGSSGLLGANAKGVGYRDILFNPDGKLRPPFRCEGVRSAHSWSCALIRGHW